MRFENADMFRRRPSAALATRSLRQTMGTSAGRRRKRNVSDGGRNTLIAVVASILIAGLFILLIDHRDKASSDETFKSGAQSHEEFLNEWKPRSLRNADDPDVGMGATKKTDIGLAAAKKVKTSVSAAKKAMGANVDDKEAKFQSLYRQKFDASELGYDIYNCPPVPPHDYPRAWSAPEVLTNWNPNDVTTIAPSYREVYHSLCIFDYQTQYKIALAYRNAEKPFVIRNDPKVTSVSKRWNDDPEYLHKFFGDENRVYTERSPTNHFMFYNSGKRKNIKGWKQPDNDVVAMTYGEWMERALERDAMALGDPEIASRVELLRERRALAKVDYETPFQDDEIVEDEDKEAIKRKKWYYFRATAFLEDSEDEVEEADIDDPNKAISRFLYEELPFFDPRKREDSQFYMVDPKKERGINCRFGMRGVVAANHYDLNRNMIALLGGERRYVIGHPSQCSKMGLYEYSHPSGRHSSFDWANPAEWTTYPEFKEAQVNEVVMHAGDVLYLPTAWFHYIANLGMNFQCNARSGKSMENAQYLEDCGFNPR